MFIRTGSVFFYWMGLVCLAYVYNLVAIPLRASFEHYAERGLCAWLVLDYLFDTVYILDIVTVQCHVSYSYNGVLEVCVCHVTCSSSHVTRLSLDLAYSYNAIQIQCITLSSGSYTTIMCSVGHVTVGHT